MKYDRAKFAEKLRSLRGSRLLTQAQLGEAIGVSEDAICKYENGAVCPGIDKVFALASFFGCDINEMCGWNDLCGFGGSS